MKAQELKGISKLESSLNSEFNILIDSFLQEAKMGRPGMAVFTSHVDKYSDRLKELGYEIVERDEYCHPNKIYVYWDKPKTEQNPPIEFQYEDLLFLTDMLVAQHEGQGRTKEEMIKTILSFLKREGLNTAVPMEFHYRKLELKLDIITPAWKPDKNI